MKSLRYPLLLLIISAFAGASCSRSARFRQDEGAVWNTVWHSTYESAEDLRDSITAVLEDVGRSLSAFDSLSWVSAVNANRSDSADGHLKTVLLKSKDIWKLTGGAFDPTLSPLITAWGFGKGHKPTADTLRIDSLLSITGLEKISLNGDRIIKAKPEVTMNFSAIAKGYGADKVAEMFRRNGVENFLIEIGGEIFCGGRSPSGGKWVIGIDSPDEKNRDSHEIQQTIAISGCGMATSGNYRNFHKKGGVSMGHTISPVTGRPVASDIASATVIAGDCMEADALATAFMVLGAEKSMMIAKAEGIAVMLILTDFSILRSPEFVKQTEEK